MQSNRHRKTCNYWRLQPNILICEPCGARVTSPENLADHLRGAKHARRAELFHCLSCGVTTTGPVPMLAHLAGSTHAVSPP